MARQLAREERALWAKVVATVKPLGRVASPIHSHPVAHTSGPSSHAEQARPVQPPIAGRKPAALSANTLDGSWDRRLDRGLASPEMVIDLHDHNLATAHALLDSRLEAAITGGARLVLLITGKPPRDDRRPIARGAIRAAIDDWLHASRHAGSIAAVRNAHPRHGGAGALYIVLRRRRHPVSSDDGRRRIS